MSRPTLLAALLATGFAAHALVLAQGPPALSDAVKAYVKVDGPVIALTNARVIDGTGAPARAGQTVIIRNGTIAELGDSARITVPTGAVTVDLTGKSLIPGLVMVHEHLYYPTGPGVYGQLGESFTRLYLAGGVTTMRTGGNVNGFMDINLMRAIEKGAKVGPAIDATAPYVNGPNAFIQMSTIESPESAQRHVAYWADAGATSIKAYMNITRAALGAAIREAHQRKMKVTGHLCSVTYSEAADLGIDNLEHGFLASTDFVTDKKPDACPGQGAGQTDDRRTRRERRALQDARQEARRQACGADFDADRVRDVHARTSTAARARRAHAAAEATVRAEVCDGVAEQGLDLPEALPQGDGARARLCARGRHAHRRHRPDRLRRRPAGLLEPAPGRAAGRSRVLARSRPSRSRRSTARGYLGRDTRVGSIAPGKQADLVVVDGDPSATIADIRKVETVFRQGIGFDPAKLTASVTGRVGLW